MLERVFFLADQILERSRSHEGKDVQRAYRGSEEAVWVFSVEDLGPLVVTISKGRNYYLEVEKKVLSVKENLLKRWIK